MDLVDKKTSLVISNIIISANDVQEKFELSNKSRLEIMEFGKSINEIKNTRKSYPFNPSIEHIMDKQVVELEKVLKELNSKKPEMSSEMLEIKMGKIVEKYINIEKTTISHDTFIDFKSKYSTGTASLLKKIKELNDSGLNIEILYQNKVGYKSNIVGSFDSRFVISMQIKDYKNFMDEINKENHNPNFNIVGQRSDYFVLRHLDNRLSLEEIKDCVKESIDKTGYPNSSFNRSIGIAYSKLQGGVMDYGLRTFKTVENLISQIRTLEKPKTKYSQELLNLNISDYMYTADVNNEILKGMPVTPLSEAKRCIHINEIPLVKNRKYEVGKQKI